MVESVDVTVTVEGDDAADELRSLWACLAEEEELRGRARMVEAPPVPGTLGVDPQSLAVALGPGGAVAVFAGVLVAWLRQRSSDVTVKATRNGDRVTVEVSVRRLRNLDPPGLQLQIAELQHVLAATPEGTRDSVRSSPAE